MFNKVLVANRGEIACRIIQTARRLGIRTVAVFSTVDSTSKHVSLADEAWCIGAAPASESYLQGEKIIEIALRTGAEAIHPGYGFLAENAEFAQLCLENNLVFIGPPVSAIKAMGSKRNAKEIMSKAGVPLVPGYHGKDQSPEHLLTSAEEIGFPVMLKPTAGGGGKGMRIVHSGASFSDALESCKREAKASFSDDEILIEKYLLHPRHVEIQIFCDNHGNGVHLFERDCSVQRRHQKVIEEAPAPEIPDAIRASMAEVAKTAAQTIGYSGAGTIEFLYDGEHDFYFMEMNTRLQVEHPVTEMITGIDLVEWQLLVAAGQALPLQQDQIQQNGHGFEVRIYAEDPDNDFLPATGKLVHLDFPKESTHVRVDTGIRQGDAVSMYYDPMIAKLIVWERDRSTALARLRGALDDFQVVGVTSNIGFLRTLSANDSFNQVKLDTGIIEREQQSLFAAKPAVTDEYIAMAALYVLLKRIEQAHGDAKLSSDPHSPWHHVSGWRSNQPNFHTLEFVDYQRKGQEVDDMDGRIQAIIHFIGANYQIEVNDRSFTASGNLENGKISANLSGQMFEAKVIEHQGDFHILSHGLSVVLGFMDDEHQLPEDETAGNLSAPMSGAIIDVRVSAGETVQRGQVLLILEAMKMEHTISAPLTGTVKTLPYRIGDMVEEGSELIAIEPLKE